MAGEPKSLSSIFDDMLARNRGRIDALYRGGSPSNAAGSGEGAGTAVAPATTSTSALRFDPTKSVAVRRLNERFGDRWRYEIAAQNREGDEAIVLCKVILDENGTVKTQFGRAPIGGGPVVGSAGGMRFKIGTHDAARDEANAFRRATEAALTKCMEML